MKRTPKETLKLVRKLLADKAAIRKCIREGGSLKKLGEERGIKFTMPIKIEDLNK